MFRTGAAVLVPARIRYSVRADRRFGLSFSVIPRIRGRREVDVLASVDVWRGATTGDITVWSEVWIDAQAITSNI